MTRRHRAELPPLRSTIDPDLVDDLEARAIAAAEAGGNDFAIANSAAALFAAGMRLTARVAEAQSRTGRDRP